jgi:Protein of unknown function (DUF1778)
VVTTLADGRGQTTLKGREITAEWENLIRKAAERTSSTVAGFVVTHTTPAAQAILKNEPVGPVALPIRLEDIAADLTDRLAQIAGGQADGMARLEAAQAERIARLEATQAERLARIEREARRGRWRR